MALLHKPRPVRTVRHRVGLPPLLPWQREFQEAVADPRTMFVLAVMGRRAGKTHVCSDVAGRQSLARHDETPWITPTDAIGARTRHKIIKPMWSGVISKTGTVESPVPRVQFLGGGHLTFFSTHSKWTKAGGGKGLGILGGGFRLVVLDEGARMPWGLVEEEIIPTVADTGGKIVIPTTPKGKQNWIYRQIYLKAMDGDPRYRMVRGPSTMNPNPNVRRFVEWAKENMDPITYRQEIEAEFIEGTGTVFRNILVNATLAGWRDRPVEGCSYVLGCDLAKHQDWTVIVAMDIDTGEVHGMDRFQHLSWPIIEDRLKNFAHRWGGGDIFLDSTGVGDPIYDHLEAAGVAVRGTKFTNESKARLVQGLAQAMDLQEISYPPDEIVTAELDAFDYEITPSGKFTYNAPEGFHDDVVVALALAQFGRNQVMTGVPI